MPDISMCANSSTCPLARTCYRATESGTKPSGERQSWAFHRWRETEDGGACCADYIEVERTASERAAVLFAKTQAEHSGKPQSEVNAIVRDAIVNIQAKDVTPSAGAEAALEPGESLDEEEM